MVSDRTSDVTPLVKIRKSQAVIKSGLLRLTRSFQGGEGGSKRVDTCRSKYYVLCRSGVLWNTEHTRSAFHGGTERRGSH